MSDLRIGWKDSVTLSTHTDHERFEAREAGFKLDSVPFGLGFWPTPGTALFAQPPARLSTLCRSEPWRKIEYLYRAGGLGPRIRTKPFAQDKKPDTRGTGGARRNYVSVPVAQIVNYGGQAAVANELRWNKEQLRRSLWHRPFRMSGDQYSRRYVNRGTPDEWNLTWKNARGYTGYDVQHADHARMTDFAALGDELALVNSYAVCRGIVRSEHGTTNWLTAERGVAWYLLWCRYGALLDFGETSATEEAWNLHTPVVRPSEALAAAVDQYHALVEQGEGWEPASAAVQFKRNFMSCILLWALARLIREEAVPGRGPLLRKMFDVHLSRLERYSLTPFGCPYNYGTAEFKTRARAQEYADQKNTSGASGFQVREMPTGAFNVVQGIRNADYELLAPAVALIHGPDHEIVQRYERLKGIGAYPQYDWPIFAAQAQSRTTAERWLL